MNQYQKIFSSYYIMLAVIVRAKQQINWSIHMNKYDLKLDNSLIDSLDGISQLNHTLINLTLSSNKIEKINEIGNLTKLERLDLSNNRVESIPNSICNNLIYLTNLSLEFNQIDKITCIPSSLVILSISFNRLSEFKVESNNLNYSLIKLSLNNNQIRDINWLCDSNFIYLEELNLNNNSIESLDCIRPSNLPQNLRILLISHNKLTSVKKELIDNLIGLKRLNLAGNQIFDLEEFDGPNLRSLDLSQNFITNIDSLNKLHQLEILFLSENQISNLTALKNLTRIKKLYLTKNQISNVEALANLSTLEALYLDTNTIRNIDPISNLINLTFLQLSKNNITNVSSLNSLINLKFLHLSNNQIEFIDDFDGLVNLTGVALSSNKIKSISSNFFTNKKRLIKIFLNRNQLELNENLLKSFEKTESIEVINLVSVKRLNVRKLFDLKKMLYLKTFHLNSTQIDETKFYSMIKEKNMRIIKQKLTYLFLRSFSVNFVDDPIDCYLIVDLLRKNVLVNLHTDKHVEMFFKKCRLAF